MMTAGSAASVNPQPEAGDLGQFCRHASTSSYSTSLKGIRPARNFPSCAWSSWSTQSFLGYYRPNFWMVACLLLLQVTAQGLVRPVGAAICMATLHDQFNEGAMGLASSLDYQQLEERYNASLQENHGQEPPFLTNILFLNKAYALRHKYNFFVSNGTQYREQQQKDQVNSAWLRILFVQDILRNNQECEWVLWLDADATVWMGGHTFSIEEWLASTSVHELSHNFMAEDLRRIRMRGHVPFNLHGSHFMAGLNGISRGTDANGYSGFPGNFLGRPSFDQDYICSGIWFVRNSAVGREMLENWWGYIHKVETWKLNHPYEQRVLNLYILPLYQIHVAVYSFQHIGNINSNGIRHLWRDAGDVRDALAKRMVHYIRSPKNHNARIRSAELDSENHVRKLRG